MKKIGIIGGGQLGRMLAMSAKSFGYHVTILDPTEHCPAAQVADEHILGDFANAGDVRALAASVDILTFEIESAHAGALLELTATNKIIHPEPSVLQIIKDKYKQSVFLSDHEIPVAEFASVDSADDVKRIAEKFGYPLLLKARTGAYDGRGNRLIKSKADVERACEELSTGSKLYVEKFVPFVKELAVVAVRGADSTVLTYPVVETIHKNNICHTVHAPADISSDIVEKAHVLADRVLTHLKGIGVYGIEMFLTEDGDVLINEIAPRVHNSGHHTIDACVTSQFENHIRAVTGLSLGETHMHTEHAVMINILGDRTGPAEVKGLTEALAIPDVHVHIYGKHDTKVERKMGHITACAQTAEEAYTKAIQARKLISI